MGVDRRQSHRTQKVAVATAKTSVNKNPLQGVTIKPDIRQWYEWIFSMDAHNVSITRFYLGSNKLKGSPGLTDGDKEFILRELFLDAIDNGAISFTPKLNPKDFSFKLIGSSKIKSYIGPVMAMEYAAPGIKKVKGDAPFPNYYLANDRKMAEVANIFRSFKDGIRAAKSF